MSNIIDNNTTGMRNVDLTGNKKSSGKTTTPGPADTSKAPTSGGGGETERVEISSSPDMLKSAQSVIEQTPEVNMDKVEAIKQQIAAGQYPIDADRIASKMMDLERLLS